MRFIAIAAVTMSLFAGEARAAEVRLLSAGAVQPGVDAVIAEFQRRTGDTVAVVYNTGPQMQARLAEGETPDLLIAPVSVATPLAARFAAPAAALGKVGVGVAVRKGAAAPDIAAVAPLKAAILAARAVVFNRASTGQHMEAVLKKMGVDEAVAPRTVRTADGEGVLLELQMGSDGEIGFAAITEILLAAGRGEAVSFVGPLPEEIQNETAYVLARFPSAAAPATAFYDLLTSPEGKALMAAKGIR